MRLAVVVGLAVAFALGLYFVLDFSGITIWAAETQRGFQNQMAAAVRALQAGEAGAYIALLGATGAYGFVHALGPGHGKYLVGGVGLGTSLSTARLLGLAVASSLAQALWAIILVYGGFFLLEVSASQLTDLAQDILAPVSYLAIACIGVAIAWRGVRSLKVAKASHGHSHGDCGCHGHGPTPEEAANLSSAREALALILSIAIRPCTGAIFLLVIAWQMDIKIAGIAAVVVMGLGTASLTSLVALSSTFGRRLTSVATLQANGSLKDVIPALQIFAGASVFLLSMGLLGFVN